MKTFKERLMAVLTALGFVEKQKTGKLSTEDMDQVVAKYNETHSADFFADMKADQEQAQKAAALDAAMAVLAGMTSDDKSEGEGTQAAASEQGAEAVNLAQAIKDLATKNATLEKVNKENSDKIEKLSKSLEEDTSKNSPMKVEGFALTHTDKFAFGIEHPMFAADKRWNQITINPKVAVLGAPTEEDEKAFKAEVNGFGKRLAQRYAFLKENDLLDPQRLMTSSTLDITEVGTALGNYLVVRRTDALIARLLSIPTIYDFFPRRYGIQDMDVINNVLVGEVSSAWQKGKVFKGAVEVKPEQGHVDDVSIKLQFEPLTDIERNYLGYKNTEGSDPVKYGMIEYYAMVVLEKAIIEQTKRKVMGCYVKPETDKSGSYMNASTGIIFTLIRYAHQYKMQLISDAAYAEYDSTDFLATVLAFLAKFADIIGDDEIDQYTLVLNRKHKPWWIQNVRSTYGNNSDFTGPKSNEVPDYGMPIYWLPAMGNSNAMFLCKAGNIQCLENLPGEMLALKFENDFEDVLVRSRHKEGTAAAFVGKKFTSAALLAANAYENQQIFMNKPALALVDDSITLDGSKNFWFVSIANTTAGKKILEVANAVKGQVYIIECGSATNPQSINKALKFANITAAWTPTAVGDYIMVILNDAGDEYRELERCVGGTRTVNSLVQPTLPEARS
ncbi:MAG: hypothetical protein JZU49_00925 [Sulfuricurvum sp.]|nr:hypothetical protein [Sulfuricurvum sp.]